MPDVSCLVTATVLNTRIGVVKKKMPHASSLMATTVLNGKSDELRTKCQMLFKKKDYNADLSGIEKKCLTSSY